MLEIKNQIIIFFFCLTRKHNPKDITDLSILLDNILTILKSKLYECDDTIEIDIYVSYFILLYKLIAYTRDICGGKGERDLTYMMIDIWYKHFPILAKNMLEIIPENYGSWKDLKYFCKYTKNEKHMDDCIKIWNNQLENDLYFSNSNVSKWIPREKSAFGWLFEKSAIEWHSRNYKTPISINRQKKEYRQTLSYLYLSSFKTPSWREEKGSILNALNLPLQMEMDTKKQRHIIHSHSFHLGEYIKNPHLQNQTYWEEIKTDILQTRKREKVYMIPIVNISVINTEEYNNALGIGCMISEISGIRDRILVYDQHASWLDTSSLDLEQKIQILREKTIIKGNCNIFNAIELIKTEPNIIWIIISDFAMEPFDLNKQIIEMVAPNECPKIVYWNIGSKIPFFQIEDTENENILVSGSSSSTLKYIYQNIEKMTDTYSYIQDIVNQERYKIVEEYFKTRMKEEEER